MTCDVCEAIIAVFSTSFDEWGEAALGEVSTVLDSDCSHAESLRRAANFERPITDFPNALLAIKKSRKQTGVRLALACWGPNDTIIFDEVSMTYLDLVAPRGSVNHPGQGILPDIAWIDLEIVRGWLSTCKTLHQPQCSEPPRLKGVEPVDPEFLIDVVDNCIVSPPEIGVDYVALSYTRGLGQSLKNTKATLDDLMQPGALNLPKFASQLPETIRNTIDLVRLLGERYLWVDALCIIQDDPSSLGRNLNQMLLIYANATFCVVAAAGYGAEVGLRGLRGLSPERDIETCIYDLADGNRLIAEPQSQVPTERTKYSYHQRGWTYQEYSFSRRCLVFNDGPLMWQCKCARWREILKINPEVDAQWRRISRASRGLYPSPSIWDFMSKASWFNSRAFTMPEDAPRAFAGIQAMLHRVHPGGLLYGLSEFFFDISLAWTSLHHSIQRRRGSNPANALQDGLPSWSWLGWQGNFEFHLDAEFQVMPPWNYHNQKVGFREPVTEWFTMATPASTTRRRVKSEWHRYKSQFNTDSSAPLPDGWRREGYDKEEYSHDFYPPGGQPRNIFFHELHPEYGYKYPVPVLNWTDTPSLSDQTQYLWCETSRAQLVTSKTALLGVKYHERCIRFVEGNSTVLSVTMPDMESVEEMMDEKRRPSTLQLVAFARGWSTWLGRGVEQPDDEESAGLQAPTPEHGVLLTFLGDTIILEKDARDCYFVLWVERRGDVSYRLASGEALATWWEENREKQLAQVVLG